MSIATALKANAAPTPMTISVNMFKCRVTTERQPRWTNGQPAHQTTGVVRANWIQREAWPSTQDCLASCRDQVSHRQDKHRQCQRGGDPESPRHVVAAQRLLRDPCPLSRSSVPAPCHTWGNRRAVPVALRDASGTCKCSSAPASTRDDARGPSRISSKLPGCPTRSQGTSGNNIGGQQQASPLRVWNRYHSRPASPPIPPCRRNKKCRRGPQVATPPKTVSGNAHYKSRTTVRRVQRGAPTPRPPSFRKSGLWSCWARIDEVSLLSLKRRVRLALQPLSRDAATGLPFFFRPVRGGKSPENRGLYHSLNFQPSTKPMPKHQSATTPGRLR